jgi:hypothetical protein
MRSILLILAPLALALASCTFHTNARVWNGVLGPDGKPVYYKSTTQVGWHLFGLWPVFGDARSGAAIDQLTASIAAEHGNHVRIVDEDVSFLWWAVLPITLFLVPTVRSVGAQYQPAGG